MILENSEKRRFRPGTVDKIVLLVLLVLMVLLIVLGIMNNNGITLISAGLYLYGMFAGIAILVGWGAYTVFRLFRGKNARLVVGTLLAVVYFLAVMVCGSFISVLVGYSVPQKFDTVVSGDHQVVILRGIDMDEERMQQRMETRLAADPEGSSEPMPEDFGYSYYAFPQTMGVFYRSDAHVEGEIHIGYASQASLMIEWLDENTAHLFVENPEPGDGGDWYLYF